MKMQTHTKSTRYHLITLLCLSGIIFGGGFALLFPNIFKTILSQKMTLVDGTPAYDVWLENKDPAYMRMYMFHIVNPEEIANGTAKPLLKEMGPYVFREQKQKANVTQHAYNSSVTYRERKWWYFEPDMSNGSLDDYVTSLNVPAVIGQEVSRGDYWQSFLLDQTFSMVGVELFVNKTVGELLFDGYEDTLLAIAEWAGTESKIPMDKFAWFYKRNGTVWGDGEFNMFTGSDDINKMGKIHTWDQQTRTHFEGHCGEIRGSAGGFFPPNVKNQTLELFTHEACRSLAFHSTGQIESIHAVPGIVYELPTTTFANGTVNPDNWCYENNLPSGLHNGTYCKAKKSPLFISFPHFYGADPYYVNQFDSRSNFSPSKAKHGSRMVILPAMGVPMEFTLRLQLNLRVHPNPDISILTDVSEDLYIPTLWFEGGGALTKSQADLISQMLNLPQVVNYIGLGVTIVSMMGIAISLFLACNPKKKSKNIAFENVPTKEEEVVIQTENGCEMNLLSTFKNKI